MFTKEYMEKIVGQMRDHIGIHLAFGTPHKLGKIMVIPVAKISMGFGFGGGGGKQTKVKLQSNPDPDLMADEESEANEAKDQPGGGGGGMGGSAKPVGVFVISENSTRFFPVVSSTQIFVAMSIISLVWWRFWRKAFKKK